MDVLTEFSDLVVKFQKHFQKRSFPDEPGNLYDAAQYFLTFSGKQVRPVLCLMGNELFNPIYEDSFNAGMALELFHNFTLVHDDIMDHSPMRRGNPTVHEKFGTPTAILAGDVMLVRAYEYLSKVNIKYLPRLLSLFNETARQVCEGQDLDMEFENRTDIPMNDYFHMITLKTSVLLAASIKAGALIGGAGIANQENLYLFGKNLGIAFQIQDDYLDAFGNPDETGKKRGGDIMANKVTFLSVKARENADAAQAKELDRLSALKDESKIASTTLIFEECGVKDWADKTKVEYFRKALDNLEDVAVVSKRKEPLRHLANALMVRKR